MKLLTQFILLICLVNLKMVNMAAVMSVDLGSEWMKIGVVSPGYPMEIALNKESKRKTQTLINIRETTRLFGEDAQSSCFRYPENCFAYLTDLLGKSIDNPVVDLYKNRFPWHNIQEDENRKTVTFKVNNNTYSVEELLAQILEKAKEFAQDYTGQQIKEAVIVVPGYFGQSERVALLKVAQLAKLKVLQLINDYTSVALNYGISRRKEINDTAEYFIFYDMGAYKTVATVVSYQAIKDKTTKEVLPNVQVLGVYYDRILGGLEMQIRLRDYLAKQFNEMKKTKTDVFSNPRAMLKLFKEAGRVKNILSANTDTFAQIEGLIEEHDFKVKVTRENFESLCDDLLKRVPDVLNKAIELSQIPLEAIKQIVLVGGNVRMPKVQEVLKNSVKLELAKNINADEAAAMGAVYRAADLATGIKVKKFIIKDAVLFPVQVVFDKPKENGEIRKIKRMLFGTMNPYPSKKVITFNKHVEDFEFDVRYEELNHLGEEEVKRIGSDFLARVELSKVKEIMDNNLDDNVVSKGIKAHFILDDSGIFNLNNVELVLEKKVNENEDQNTFQKISNTITKLFSTSETDDVKMSNENETQPEINSTVTNTNETILEGVNKTETNITEANQKDQAKTLVLKEEIPSKISILHTNPLDEESFKFLEEKIGTLNEIEDNKRKLENALNSLESFVIDTQMKMDMEEYRVCATEEEITNILKLCSDISEWIYEDGFNAGISEYETKLDEIKVLANKVYEKHWEHNERPEAVKALKTMINGSEDFLKNAKNLSIENNSERGVFTQIELENLENIIRETTSWLKTEIEEQDKLERHTPVRLTVNLITEKMSALDREVKYLVNKIKLWKPKPNPKTKAENKKPGSNDEKPEQNEKDEKVDKKEENSESNETKETENHSEL